MDHQKVVQTYSSVGSSVAGMRGGGKKNLKAALSFDMTVRKRIAWTMEGGRRREAGWRAQEEPLAGDGGWAPGDSVMFKRMSAW